MSAAARADRARASDLVARVFDPAAGASGAPAGAAAVRSAWRTRCRRLLPASWLSCGMRPSWPRSSSPARPSSPRTSSPVSALRLRRLLRCLGRRSRRRGGRRVGRRRCRLRRRRLLGRRCLLGGRRLLRRCRLRGRRLRPGGRFLAGVAFLVGAAFLAAAAFFAGAASWSRPSPPVPLLGRRRLLGGRRILGGGRLLGRRCLGGRGLLRGRRPGRRGRLLGRRAAAPLTAAVPFAGASFAAFLVVAATVRPALACLPVAFVAVPALALAAGRAGPALAADAFDPVVEVAALRAAGRADAAATTVLAAGLLAAATTAFRGRRGLRPGRPSPPSTRRSSRPRCAGADGATTVFAVDGRAVAGRARLRRRGPAHGTNGGPVGRRFRRSRTGTRTRRCPGQARRHRTRPGRRRWRGVCPLGHGVPHLQNGRAAGSLRTPEARKDTEREDRRQHGAPIATGRRPDQPLIRAKGTLAGYSSRSRPCSSNHLASRPRRLTARSRRSAASRTAAVATISRLSPARSRVSGAGHEAGPVAEHQRDRPRPTGSRSSSMCTPASCEPAGISSCSRSAPHPLQRCGLDPQLGRLRRARSPAAAARPAAACRPARSVKTTTSTNTTSKSRVAPVTPAESGIVASTIGTAPRSPAHDRKAWSRQPIRNGVADDQHRQRTGDEAPARARSTSAGITASAQPVGRREQAEQHEQPDLRQPGQPVGEPEDRTAGAAAGRCRARTPATYTARKPDACSDRAGGVGQHGQPDRGERIQAGRRQRGLAQRPRARPMPTTNPIAAPAASS